MQINITDPYLQTILFTIILSAFIIFSFRKDPNPNELNQSHTNELKGVAILMVIFSHIGYFLFTDHRFLYPLSVAGGVGVNIFLFLSGFGLTISETKSKRSVLSFYSKRLKNIFIPMWLVLVSTLILDFYILNRTYSVTTIIQNILGFFPNGDIDSAINSPLWYFSLILFYYLVFPVVFIRKKPWLSALILLIIGYFVTKIALPVSSDVLKLYKLHYLAFPLGMLFAYFKDIVLKQLVALNRFLIVRYLLLISLSILVGYTAINSGVGDTLWTEQATSLVTVASLLLIFLIKPVQSKFLILLGVYSYEIYLIQWPLMYRFDFIYKYTPAFLGTLLYLGIFIIAGFVLNMVRVKK